MSIFENASLSFIKFSRKYFRNTWVHRLPITHWVFKRVFSLTYNEPEKVIEFRNKKFLVYTKDTSMVPSIINQDYESFELDIFEKILRPGMTVLDIGANLGIYAVIGSKLVGDNGSIHSFEPVPENLTLLRHNVKLNRVGNVRVVPSAVGSKVGNISMFLNEDNIGTHSMGSLSGQEIEVGITTVDQYVKENKLSVDVIKMDIEGYEGQVIKGAEKTLSKKNVLLLTEFVSKLILQCGDNPKKVAELLLGSFSYCYEIDERARTLTRLADVSKLAELDNSNLLLTNSLEVIKRI